MSEVLFSKIATLRRKEQSVGAGKALTLGTAYLVVALGIGMLLDWFVDLPLIARVLLLAMDLAVLGWIAFALAIRLLVHPADDETLALEVERQEPRFEGRLICSVQLSRADSIPAGASTSLVAATIQQAVAIADGVNFGSMVPTQTLARWMMGTLVLVVVWMALLVSFASAGIPLLERAFLLPVSVPRKTEVIPVSKDKIIATGDSFTIEALAGGIKPASGKAILNDASGVTQEIALHLLPQTQNDFAAIVENIQGPVRYTVYLGDNHGQTYAITTTPRPWVTGVKCWQIFPPYTHLPPLVRRPGDLVNLLRGSRLVFSIQANKPLRQTTEVDVPFNRIHLSGTDVPDASLIINPAVDITHDHQPANAATDPAGVLLPDDATGLSILLVDENGIESKDGAVYPLSLVDKAKPVIKLIEPRDNQVLALPTDTVAISFSAHDDFALGDLSLHCKVEGDAKEITVPIPLNGTPADITATFAWNLATLQKALSSVNPKPEATELDCWLRAQDTDNVSNPDRQPNFGDSDHFQLKIATQEEIDAHLHDLQHDAMGAIELMTQHQQQTNDDFAHRLLKKPAATQPTTRP